VFTQTQSELLVAAAGNTFARPRIALTPSADATQPSIGVGERVLACDLLVPAGSTLLVDAAAGKVLLEGEDVTPYTQGLPPLFAPGPNTLVYADHSPAMPTVAVACAFRARWW